MENRAKILLSLTKYRLSLAVSLSSLTGYLLTGNCTMVNASALFTGVFLLSCGSAAFNQFQEHRYDALMDRTKNRAIPSGEISPLKAFGISILLMGIGLVLLAFAGRLSIILGGLNVILYNLIYTPLKRVTSFSIIPGAMVGAVCPLIGWTAGGQPLFHPIALFISLFVFLWQLPHFWLLLIRHGRDYRRAGFPVFLSFMSVEQIKKLVFTWTLLTSAFLFSFPFFGFTMKPLLISALTLINVSFILIFFRLLFRKQSLFNYRLAFFLINSFMMIILTLFVFSQR